MNCWRGRPSATSGEDEGPWDMERTFRRGEARPRVKIECWMKMSSVRSLDEEGAAEGGGGFDAASGGVVAC